MGKYTEADMAFLQDLKDTSAYELARMAGAHVHSGIEGPAAEILGEVRDAVVERWEAGRFDWDSANNDSDLISECADEGIITDYTHERMLLLVDLGAYGNDNEHSMSGEWSGTFHDMAGEAIEQVTYRAASACVEWARTCFNNEFECADCGDSGTPHICYPGDCRGSDEDREAWAMAKEAERLSAAPDTATDPTQAPMPTEGPSEADRALWAQALSESHNDPLYRLLEANPSETQRFLANMAAHNREEFARRQRIRTIVGVLAVAVSGVLVLGLAWFLLGGY